MVETSGPLAGTKLLKSGLIQLIVPFLPLKHEHVEECIVRELRMNGFIEPRIIPGNEFIRNISYKQTYWKNLYSQEGCRNIDDIIKRHVILKKI